MVFKCFAEVEAQRFRLLNEVFVDVKNEIMFVSQVYLHPRACGGSSTIYVWSFITLIS